MPPPIDPNQDPANASISAPSLRAADILERVKDAFVALDSRWRILYANREACRISGKPLEAFQGRLHWDEWPGAVGTDLERHLRRVMDDRVEAHFEHLSVAGAAGVWLEIDVYPAADGGLNIFYRDITERRRAQARVQNSQEDLRLAVDAARLGTFYCDYPLNKILWNDTCCEHFFLPLGTEVDFALFYSLLYPDDREPTRQAIESALRDHAEYNVEYRTLASDGRTRWINAVGRFRYDAAGNPTRFDGVTRDISRRKAAEEEVRRRAAQEQFLSALAERARKLTAPEEVIADAMRSLGRFLGAARCVFADIDLEADECTVPVDYCANETVASIAGTFPISAFGSFVVAEYKAGRVAVVDSIYADAVKVPPQTVAAYEAIGVRAYVAAPVLHSARLVSAIAVHSTTPRQWQPEEVELIQAVVERTWLTVEVLRQQRTLMHEAQERQAVSARIAAILESITDAFFALDRSWNFTFLNAQAERLLARTQEELLGRSVWAEFPSAVGSTFEHQYRRAAREGVSVSFEEFFPPLETWFEVRAYPSEDGLSVFFQNVNERKALEAERAQIAEREHRIAQQLQDALQPPLPGDVPGLAAGKFTRPALEEAQVGGDFYDLFPLDKERYALVLGDVSGKGLAAAQQLALIRNSLRTTLYLSHSPAQAASALNQIVTAHDLLVGFVTAFVGVYDAGTGGITYCSCGHEPGLIRRASGTTEEMETTGPPLGVAESARYEEKAVTLSSGDTLLLYTDGLSEAGPSRRDLLGTGGLTRLFGALPAGPEVQTQAEALVAEVAAFSEGVFHDDVAVLLLRRL